MELDFSVDGLPAFSWGSAYAKDDIANVEICGHKLRVEMVLPVDCGDNDIGTGAVLWDGGVQLAEILEHRLEELLCGFSGRATNRCLRAVELGAGCTGLPGVTLALKGFEVKLTDVSSVLEPLVRNLRAYAASIRADGHSAHAEEILAMSVQGFDWCSQEDTALYSRSAAFDLVVCADGNYDVASHAQLVTATAAVLAADLGATAVFYTDGRSDFVINAFKTSLEAMFAVEELSFVKEPISVQASYRVSGSRVFVARWPSVDVAHAVRAQLACDVQGSADTSKPSGSDQQFPSRSAVVFVSPRRLHYLVECLFYTAGFAVLAHIWVYITCCGS
eukprot:gnl/TRDRNA2_/TRDRNA2_199795_c0_seq1.p1 gnl/TRDRNA2_/TRDRNA2_199795_c0~~gnl/TRDRNA2_/TRDRNA2_199795_c0_seq1.p1  ORF type:complete len:333 (-),score=36.54 gnl/TRDRNA2_/TRDRNA2_199795_c0_seq1:322-1320(-)